MIQNESMRVDEGVNHGQHPTQSSNHVATNASNNQASDGTWLLITSTMGLTLGYVRIDDHDHDLALSEIRDMISDKLKENNEYRHGFNFGTGWPFKVVHENEERSMFAKDVLPSVSVLSAHSAQQFSASGDANGFQYPVSSGALLPMNFMGFPNTAASTAGLQPLPISALFTPLHAVPQDSNEKRIGYQAVSANTVALLQPHPHAYPHTQQHQHQQQQRPQPADLDRDSPKNNGHAANIPSLPPFSPPVLSQQELDQKQQLQKKKLQNLLPGRQLKVESLTPDRSQKGEHTSNRIKMSLPRLKPIAADGSVIETSNASADTLPPDIQCFSCNKCEALFDTDRKLRRHLTKVHQVKMPRGRNKERRFQCDHAGCDRSFYQSSDLRRHQRVHLGVKPFKCSLCRKEFTQRGSLYRHIKSAHKGKDPKTLIILQGTGKTLPNGQQSCSPTGEHVHEHGDDTAEHMDAIANGTDGVSVTVHDLPPACHMNQNIPPPLSGEDMTNIPPPLEQEVPKKEVTATLNDIITETVALSDTVTVASTDTITVAPTDTITVVPTNTQPTADTHPPTEIKQ